MVRLATPLALGVAIAFGASAPVDASQRTCRQLEAQIAGSEGGGGAKFQKYDRAVEAQRAQLSKARGQARNAGCGFSLLGGGKERCGPLNTTIERMERNLLALQRKRTELSGGKLSRSERARLVAALDANGCRGDRTATREVSVEPSDGRSLFDQLFGGGVKKRETVDDESDGQRVTRVLRPGASEGIVKSGGGYRTLCVRTCDGYYFPISGASSQSDFERDQKNCEAMCPGTEVKLFFHNAATEESEMMVSVADGRPYTEMPTAFRHRDASVPRDETCGCNPVKNFSIIAGEPPREAPTAAVEPIVPQPVARPDPAADPETLANADGGLTVETIKSMLKPKPAEEPKTASTGKVRVVGPAFLPDPEGAIDLRAPAQPKVQ